MTQLSSAPSVSSDAPPDSSEALARPTFDALPLSPEVRRAVDDLGFTHPSPVQLAVFEPASQGLDLVVQARTGTGKTAAFGLPIIDRLTDPSRARPQALVLAPTRELALQISRELGNLTKYKPLRCVAVYGGASMQPQIDALKEGVHIISGTPGRVLDHLERRTLDPSSLRLLVLDESDEMLSMGFLPQITRIMEALPKQRQTLLFSATLPPDVRRIAETRLKEPRFITLSGDHVGALSIQHFVYRSRGRKPDELVQIIEVENPESAIVFCNTRDQTKRIAQALQQAGYAADWLNADLAQNDREKVMQATRNGSLRFLVATDVAARGIDISHLTHVINADFPESTENYVHRTGRTGRAGRTGTAISLIAPQDVGNLYMLRLTYKIFPLERDLPSARELSSRKEADLVAWLSESLGQGLKGEELSLARRVLSSDAAESIVAGLLREHLQKSDGDAEAAAELRRHGEKKAALGEHDGKKHKKGKDKKKHKKKHDEQETAATDAVPTEAALPGAGWAGPTPADARREERPSTESAESFPPPPSLEIVSAKHLLGSAVLDLLDQAAPVSPASAPTKVRPSSPSDSARIFVSLGRRDGATVGEFRELLERDGIHPDDIDYISVKDTHTFVGVPSDLLHDAIEVLNGTVLRGVTLRAELARPRRE